jgi:hypothetical protein
MRLASIARVTISWEVVIDSFIAQTCFTPARLSGDAMIAAVVVS